MWNALTGRDRQQRRTDVVRLVVERCHRGTKKHLLATVALTELTLGGKTQGNTLSIIYKRHWKIVRL